MREKTFEEKVKTYFRNKGAKVIKYHGDKFSEVGVPDLLVCHQSNFIGIELKTDVGKPSELQLLNLLEIKNAGGMAFILCPTRKGVRQISDYIYNKFNKYFDCTNVICFDTVKSIW